MERKKKELIESLYDNANIYIDKDSKRSNYDLDLDIDNDNNNSYKKTYDEDGIPSTKIRALDGKSNNFLSKAPPLKICIDGNYYDVPPEVFGSEGGLGWQSNGKQTIEVGGEPLSVGWSINFTVLGPKKNS